MAKFFGWEADAGISNLKHGAASEIEYQSTGTEL